MPEVILGLPWLDKYNICLTFSNEKRTLTDSQGNTVALIKDNDEAVEDVYRLTYEAYYTELAKSVEQESNLKGYAYENMTPEMLKGDESEDRIPEELMNLKHPPEQPRVYNKRPKKLNSIPLLNSKIRCRTIYRQEVIQYHSL